MNDVSGRTQTQARHGLGVAILVDGENVSHKHADAILRRSAPRGEIAVKRVYGNVEKIPGWESTPGFRFVHTGSGKNSADMMLVIDALDLAHTGSIGTFIIVSSDSDFSHLSYYLKERHFTVIGVGESAKSTEAHRQSYTIFAALEKQESMQGAEPSNSSPAAKPALNELDRKLCNLIGAESDGLLVSKVNGLIRRSLDIKISGRREKTWPKYFAEKAHLYICDPKGPNARVRLKQAQTPN